MTEAISSIGVKLILSKETWGFIGANIYRAVLYGKLWFTLSENFFRNRIFHIWDLGIVSASCCAHVISEYLHSLPEFTLSYALLSHVRESTFEKSGCRMCACRICAFRKPGSTLSEIFCLFSISVSLRPGRANRTGTHDSTNSLSLYNKSYVGYIHIFICYQCYRTRIITFRLWGHVAFLAYPVGARLDLNGPCDEALSMNGNYSSQFFCFDHASWLIQRCLALL